jgi:hypothetical protein
MMAKPSSQLDGRKLQDTILVLRPSARLSSCYLDTAFRDQKIAVTTLIGLIFLNFAQY